MALRKHKIMCLLSLVAILSLSLTFVVMYDQITASTISVLLDTNEPLSSPSDWKFQTPKHYNSTELFAWTEARPSVQHTIIPGNGEDGEAFTRIDASDAEMKKLQMKHNYNLMATEMMSLHRRLPDYRCDECIQLVYPSKLPKASFILIFHDEAWSLILRSIWSIIERSPRELIEEIILVDDMSTWPELERPLEDYIELMPARIRLIRNVKREGLIRSRLIGADVAKGQVMIFFDAHVEVTAGYLEPLLANIAADRSLVAVPHIDWISSSKLSFDAADDYQFSRYSWELGLYWTDIPERERIRTNHSKTALIRLPMHVGCAFAIDRDFFYELGAYDKGMEIWGSENLELALRAWMCGGSLQLVQCSRIGHFYRISTYSFDGDKEEIMLRNDKRLAEVWMDEFKEILYRMKPYMRGVDAGDLTERINLRQRLQCKSYKWFLETLYPENRQWHEFVALGPIKNVGDNKCIDTYDYKDGVAINSYKCHSSGGNQFFAFSRNGLIITHNDKYCIGVTKRNSTTVAAIVDCTEQTRPMYWVYDAKTQLIQHMESGHCLQSIQNGDAIILNKCNANDVKSKWILG